MISRIFFLGVLLIAAPAMAATRNDVDADSDEEEIIDFGTSETPSPDVPPPTGTGSATSPEIGNNDEAAAFAGLPVRVYGIVKPTVTYGFHGMESFGQPNETAATAAANPVVAGRFHSDGRWSFQVAQTRLGTVVNEKGHFRGQIEVDFWDPAKPSPFVNFSIRLRIAKATWAPSQHFAIDVGRDLEFHAPLSPHTINIVALQLQAGNIGQFRNQVQVFYRPKNFELGFAAGFAGDDPGTNIPTQIAGDGPLELSRSPTLAVRAALVTERFTFGASAIGTQVHFQKGTPQSRLAAAYSGAVYLTADPTDSTNIRFEASYGRNEANIGLRGIGFGRGATVAPLSTAIVQNAADMDEYGAWVSIRQAFGMSAVYGVASIAGVVNSGDVVPDYARDNGGNLVLTNGATGPGIKRNMGFRLGYELRPQRYFAFVVEAFGFDTRHALYAQDAAQVDPHQRTFGIESGFVLTF
jgi:hypothetical protein